MARTFKDLSVTAMPPDERRALAERLAFLRRETTCTWAHVNWLMDIDPGSPDVSRELLYDHGLMGNGQEMSEAEMRVHRPNLLSSRARSMGASDHLPIDASGDEYRLVTVGKARNKHVVRWDGRPLCERGKWAEGGGAETHEAGSGQPTCELCRRVLDGRWPFPEG